MYTKIELEIVHRLYKIYKEMNHILDNLQHSDLEKCIQLYNTRQNIIENLVTYRVPLELYHFVRQVGLMGKLHLERWKLRYKLNIYINLDNEFSTIFRLWYNAIYKSSI